MIDTTEQLGPEAKKFGVLSSQTGIPDIHDFSGLPQPTDLPPLPDKTLKSEKLEPQTKVESAAVVEKKDFNLDPRIKEYIGGLVIAGNSKMKVLSYDLSYAESDDDVKRILIRSNASGSLTNEQYKIIQGFFPELPQPVTESHPDALVSNTEIDPIRSRRIKTGNLASSHGIVVEGGGGYTELEKGIQGKVTQLWEKDADKIPTIARLLTGEPEDFNAKSPLAPINSAVTYEDIGPHTMEVPFEGGVIKISANEKDNTVQVSLNGNEIAKGTMTSNGPDIKLNDGLKAGFLLAQTSEERAWKLIGPLLKTFKTNS